MIGKHEMVIGNIVSELGCSLFSVGSSPLKWRRKHFSRLVLRPYVGANPHIMIVGESGGGKSNACKLIIERLAGNGANVAILDPHNEYLGLGGSISAKIYDASRSGINIFESDGMSEKEKASEITGMLRRNFRLGDVQSYTLYNCIMYTYRVTGERGKIPTMHDLLYSIRVFKRNARTAAYRNTLESLERRLSIIDSGAFSASASMRQVISHNSVFLLSNLHTSEAQSIYIEGFLRKIYTAMLASGSRSNKNRLYVVIDEAQKLGDNPIIGRIAAEGRKYGIGIIAVSQRAKPVDRDLRANVSTFISFAVREPEELNYIANFIAGGNEMGRFMQVKKALRGIGVGHAVVLGMGHAGPVIAKFSRYSGESANTAFDMVQAARGGISHADLLRIAQNRMPADAQGYITELVESGELRSCKIEGGSYAGTWYISDNHNSPEHDICTGIISRHLKSAGVRNFVHNNSYGPDVIAFSRGCRIAVEYETGSKRTDESLAMINSRKPKYDETVVLVNDASYDKYAGRVGNLFRFSDLDNATERLASAKPTPSVSGRQPSSQ